MDKRDRGTIDTADAAWPGRSRVFTAALSIGFVCSLLAIAFVDLPANDVAGYYAPMARAFGAGEFDAAFYHMIPPLKPLLAGLLAALGIEAFTALKVVSAVFFLASLWPLSRLLGRMLPEDLVAWGCLLFVVSPRLLRYSTMGTLETGKTFFLLLVADCLLSWRERPTLRRLLGLGAALGALALYRGEGILFGVPALVAVVGVELCRQTGSRARRAARALTSAALLTLTCTAVVSPWLVYEARTVGLPCLDSRQIYIARSVLARHGLASAPEPLRNKPGERVAGSTGESGGSRAWVRNSREVFRGLYPLYVLLAGIALVTGAGRRIRCVPAKWLCLAFTVFNALIFAASGFITKRYISPTIPFLLPWTVVGAQCCLGWLERLPRLSAAGARACRRAVVGLCLALLLWDGMSKVRPSWPPKPNTPREIGLWIDQERERLDTNPAPPLRSSSTWGVGYHSGRQPVILACQPQVAYWSGGDFVQFYCDSIYSYEALLLLCRENGVDILVAGPDFRRACPEFEGGHPHFDVVTDRWASSGVTVYRFRESDPGDGQTSEPR